MRVILWIWFLIVATDGIGAAIAAARLWRSRKESLACLFISLLLAGFATEAFLSAIAIAFYTPETPSLPRLALSIAGRSVKAACGWAFTLYLLGVLFPHAFEPVDAVIETVKKNGNGNGNGHDDTPPAP